MSVELKPIESESLFIECFSHGVTGLGEWCDMLEGMLSAVRAFPFQEKIGSRQINITLSNSTCRLTAEFPHSRLLQETPPPHVPLIKKFIFGAAKPCGSLSAVHMYEGKENMEAVKV